MSQPPGVRTQFSPGPALSNSVNPFRTPTTNTRVFTAVPNPVVASPIQPALPVLNRPSPTAPVSRPLQASPPTPVSQPLQSSPVQPGLPSQISFQPAPTFQPSIQGRAPLQARPQFSVRQETNTGQPAVPTFPPAVIPGQPAVPSIPPAVIPGQPAVVLPKPPQAPSEVISSWTGYESGLGIGNPRPGPEVNYVEKPDDSTAAILNAEGQPNNTFIPSEVTGVDMTRYVTSNGVSFAVSGSVPIPANWDGIYADLAEPVSLFRKSVPGLMVWVYPDVNDPGAEYTWTLERQTEPGIFEEIIQSQNSSIEEALESAKIWVRSAINEIPSYLESGLMKNLVDAWLAYNVGITCSEQSGYDLLCIRETSGGPTFLTFLVAWGSPDLESLPRFQEWSKSQAKAKHDTNELFKKYSVLVNPPPLPLQTVKLNYIQEFQQGLGFFFDRLVSNAIFGPDSLGVHFVLNFFRPCFRYAEPNGALGLSAFVYRLPDFVHPETVANRTLVLLRLAMQVPALASI